MAGAIEAPVDPTAPAPHRRYVAARGESQRLVALTSSTGARRDTRLLKLHNLPAPIPSYIETRVADGGADVFAVHAPSARGEAGNDGRVPVDLTLTSSSVFDWSWMLFDLMRASVAALSSMRPCGASCAPQIRVPTREGRIPRSRYAVVRRGAIGKRRHRP